MKISRWFWGAYSRREAQRIKKLECCFVNYCGGQYLTKLEIDMYRRVGFSGDTYEEPTIEEQFRKVEKTGNDYYECYFCEEEKSARNFQKGKIVTFFSYKRGRHSHLECDKCVLKFEAEYELRRYCEERIEPIKKDREYIKNKLREQGLPPASRTFELVELERQILNTKRELKKHRI